MRIRVTTCFWIGLLAAGAAADTTDEDFLFRLAFSLDRASNYASTAGIQASVAYPRGSSVNPAADDLVSPDDSPVVATLTNLHAWSDSGAWLTTTAGTANITVPDAGTFSFAYARTDTIDDSGNQSFEHSLKSNEFFAGYSKQLSPDLAIGFQVRFTDAEITNQATVPELPTAAGGEAQSELEEWSFSGGIHVRLNDQWSAGLAGGFAFGSVATEVVSLGAFPPPGTKLKEVDDDVRSHAVRAGLGWKVNDQLAIYGDAVFLHIETNREGSADQGRFALGVELEPLEALMVRSGVLVDTDEQVTFSAGLGLYMIPNLPIDIGYQYNAAPEVREEFGRFHLLTISFVLRF